MAILTLDGFTPEIDDSAFIASNSILIGNIKIGARSSIWYQTVIRGDVEEIIIGEESNIQDLSMGHADVGFPLIVGNRVTVGHRCIIHGCMIEDDCMIGMGAILMNGVKIGRGSIVGAGAVVLEGTEVPPFSLIAGTPAKVRKTYEEKIIDNIRLSSQHYVQNAIKVRKQTLDQAK